MPADTQQIIDAATKLGQMVSDHPAITRYKEAQKVLTDDPDASRLMEDFNRQLETLSRQEQGGFGITDAQRQGLMNLQDRIASHIKIKAMNQAQVDFVDLLRKVNQAIHRQVMDAPGAAGGAPEPHGGAGGGGNPRLVL